MPVSTCPMAELFAARTAFLRSCATLNFIAKVLLCSRHSHHCEATRFYMSYMLHVGVMSSSVKLPHFLCCCGQRHGSHGQRGESLLESTRRRWRRKMQEASCIGVSVSERQCHTAGNNERITQGCGGRLRGGAGTRRSAFGDRGGQDACRLLLHAAGKNLHTYQNQGLTERVQASGRVNNTRRGGVRQNTSNVT